jgi:hypothetical protein
MKKIFLILTMFIGLTAIAVAQDDGHQKDGSRIEAMKIAYLTKKLNLSTDEAQKFWPIYNKYVDEVRKTRQDARRSNADEIKTEEKILDIRKRFNGEFGKALSTEKVNSFFRVEKEFGTFIQKELMERRQQRLEKRRLN